MFIEYKMEYNTEDIVSVNNIQFCVFGNDEVKRYSVVGKEPYGITIPETYNGSEPKRGGLIDSRLGTTDYQVNCSTCGLNNTDCPGHFGHTELAEPCFHYGFMEAAKNILGCICIRCSKLLIYKTEKDMNDILKNRMGKARFDEIKRLTSNITYCQNPDYSCGAPIPSIRIDETGLGMLAETKVDEGEDGTTISNTGKQKIQEVLTAEDCYNILKNVSDIDCRIMGFDPKINRPENLIITMFPIPPVAIRPTIRRDTIASKSYEDSMTDKLADIIKRSVILRTNKEKSAMLNEEFKYNDAHHKALQYHIATYFDNENSSLQKSEQKTGGRLYKSVSERLKGKQGRVRGNLLGKRTNFSGRTVITSNPDIGIDELGVPLKLAMTLTFPEVITPQNIGRLSVLVRNGRDNYPGANYVFPRGNNKRPIDLRYRKKNIKLHYGDIVERHLIDGDYVLYNRQPSLHKLSMMGHKCVILRDPELTTFGMNVSVTTPYNADYDGDEMNIFVPQSVQASIELEMIANVRNQIISPDSSNTKITTKQDAPLGVYLLTRENIDIDSHHASDIVTKIKNVELNLSKVDGMSKTYDIFSALLPKKLNIVRFNDKGEKYLEIINGKLLKGALSGKIVNGVILTTILDQFGNDVATEFIDNLQRVIIQYLLSRGATVGLKDCIISKEALAKCKLALKTKRIEVENMLTEIENNPDLIDTDTLEKNMTSLLQSVTGDITKTTMSALPKENNFRILIDSNAKGKPDNISGMTSGRGQLVLNYARIQKKVNNRTFPHYFQNDDRPEARGYLESSLYEGLNPIEFFMDAMTGREGLIDTAIKSVTGDTELMILEQNKMKIIKIGEWIDNLLKNNKNIEYDEDRELAQLSNTVYIPTSDLDGKVSWGKITAITRHDPSKELYKIKTHGGRDVIVTDSHSLLIWNETINKFERISPAKIKVGSYVPVTAKLVEPPIINDFIDITQFLPKDKYIHGTDFIKAKKMLEKAMEGKSRAPPGWWDANNGTTFTLPYSIVQLFLRTLWRSNNDIICDGCIYPYASPKNDCKIMDKFELTYENGLFLGLYIAEGNSDIPSGYVQITNNDPNIIKFVENWFNKYKIHSKKSSRENHIGGTSTDIRGFSILLGRILYNLVGHGARNKFIHPDLLNGNKEFIKGLINGIISGDGTITKNSIQIGLSSPRLINDLSVCISRFGIFGKKTITRMQSNNLGTKNMADINMLTIRAQWAKIFQDEIKLISNDKQTKLNNMISTESHRNFTEHNDVVLDEIIEITKLIASEHPEYNKVYDLTVPSTLNFGLANGLHVVDTAESGYINRRLIKCMEDVAVHYDGTIRNGNNVIIQYIYGDSQLDQVKQKSTKLETIRMNNTKLKEKYHMTEKEIEEISKKFKLDKSDLNEMNDKFLKDLLNFRNNLRNTHRRANIDYRTLEDSYFMPVSFQRIIDNAIYGNESKQEDLDPIYVMESIEYLLNQNNTKLMCMSDLERNDDRSLKVIMEKLHKSLFRYGLYEFLAPRRCIYEYKLDKTKFNIIIKEIITSFNKCLVEAGEMVGCVGSQSIGEKTTQMTLNTKHSSGAGVAGMQGIPRLNEIIRKTENIKTPLMYIYMNKEKQEDKDLAYTIAAYLKYTSLYDIVKKIDIVFDNNVEDTYMIDDQIVIKAAMNLYGNFNVKPENLPWLYRFEISKEKLFEKKLTMLEIKTIFINFWDDLSGDKSKNKSYRDLIKKVINGCIMTTNDNAEKLYIHIRFDISDFNNSILLDIQNMILYEFKLKGIDNIIDVSEIDKKLYLNFNEENGEIENKQEYIVTTSGINMISLRYIKHVDNNRCYSNEINTIYRLYGIEAARKSLISEIDKVFNGEMKLNYHHISILCDVMTNSGELVSIDRHGFGRMDTDPLSKASFERTVEMFVNSAVYGEVDKLQSVSSRLIMGRAIRCGTGFPEILVDTDILENTEYNDMEMTTMIKNSIDTLKFNENSLIDDIIEKTLKEGQGDTFMI
jgi:DNA-directed RNA polymerase beta' subunit